MWVKWPGRHTFPTLSKYYNIVSDLFSITLLVNDDRIQNFLTQIPVFLPISTDVPSLSVFFSSIHVKNIHYLKT